MYKFKFIQKRNLWYLLSSTLIISAIIMSVFRLSQSLPVFNLGVDFTGGHSLMLGFENFKSSVQNSIKNKVNLDQKFTVDLRSAIFDYGIDKFSIQITKDSDVIIKTLKLENNEHTKLVEFMKNQFGDISILEIDYIGPSIGEELRTMSLWIVLLVSLFLLIYTSIRFEFSYGLSAIFALIHDSLVVLSFAILFNIEVNTVFIAALLTILGYSINDTIVVFDRIRENFEIKPEDFPVDVVNLSLNQTFSRTMHTSITTILVVLSLLIFGGVTIQTFCIVLLVGLLSGTYSSLCIASPFLVGLLMRSYNE